VNNKGIDVVCILSPYQDLWVSESGKIQAVVSYQWQFVFPLQFDYGHS
jgi:hypothetical protein